MSKSIFKTVEVISKVEVLTICIIQYNHIYKIPLVSKIVIDTTLQLAISWYYCMGYSLFLLHEVPVGTETESMGELQNFWKLQFLSR